ncbi:MAG: four helix bundle protein [Planctomycetes bacterium]|nr:four helix bundle protein [Planctomycetota bacterium]
MPRKGDDIAALFLDMAVATLALTKRLPRDESYRHIAGQLVRAATSGGANYEEARGAASRRDFVYRLRIADKEVREARYWLRLIARTCHHLAAQARPIENLACRLSAIMITSIQTANRRPTDS